MQLKTTNTKKTNKKKRSADGSRLSLLKYLVKKKSYLN